MNLKTWARAYITIGEEPFSLKSYPFLSDIYYDDHPHIVVQKASQLGFSEWCVLGALRFADDFGGNVLYVMPTQNHMDDFSKSRVKPRIEESDYLYAISSVTGRIKGLDNVRLRRLGKGYLYFRGSDKPRQIISVAADMIVRDEYDFMNPGSITMIDKRLGASQYKWKRDISTPTQPGFGINKAYLDSDRRRYLLKCPHCNTWQELDFYENVKFTTPDDGECVCARCGKPLDRLQEGEWVPEAPSKDVHGYRISRLYSPQANLKEIIIASQKTSEHDRQTFFNFELGRERSPKGGKLTRAVIMACRDTDYEFPPMSMTPSTMGVDVGRVLNVRISHETTWGRRAQYIGEVDTFAELGKLMEKYSVKMCCIDALPETRKAKEFARQYPGRVKLVFFVRQADLAKEKDSDEDVDYVQCDRTQLLDEVVEEFTLGRNILPRNVEEVPGYIEQVTNPVRVIERDRYGRDIPKWKESGPDHYLFAEAYDLLALRQGALKKTGSVFTWA